MTTVQNHHRARPTSNVFTKPLAGTLPLEMATSKRIAGVGIFPAVWGRRPQVLAAERRLPPICPPSDARALNAQARSGALGSGDAERFRGRRLTKMAEVSLDDTLLMQLHADAQHGHSSDLLRSCRQNRSGHTLAHVSVMRALRPLQSLLILLRPNETLYARDLALLLGVRSFLRLGPPSRFRDSFESARRCRQMTIKTSGILDTVAFNDNTHAFPSIPARFDVARRDDSDWLVARVVSHQLGEDEAQVIAPLLAERPAQVAYQL